MFHRAKTIGWCLLAVVVVSIPHVAMSEAPRPAAVGTGVDLTPLLVALSNVLISCVGAFATYLINARIKNQQLATLLGNAVQNGLGVIQQAAAEMANQNQAKLTITANDPVVAKGIEYVRNNAKEALDHFRISDKQVGEKLIARLGLAAIATNLATTTSAAAPVVAGPMAPVPLLGSGPVTALPAAAGAPIGRAGMQRAG